jgi:hypothetical protein
MTVNEFVGASSAGWQGGSMYSFARLLVVLSLVAVACGCEEPAVEPEALGTIRLSGPVQPGMGPVVKAIRCEGAPEADGSRLLLHEARFFSDGSVSTNCAVRFGSAEQLGSAEYPWGRTGQPGAVCVVEVEGGYWRFSVSQDRASTVATHYPLASSQRSTTWLLECVSW